jgi:WD40 repeat protein
VGSIAVSPDNTRVVSGSADGRIRLWNVGEGNVIGDPWDGHNAIVRCLDWSPNGLEILSGSEDDTLRRWNPDTGKQIISTTETGHGWVFAVKYSPQGDKYASCGMDGIIRVWSNDGEPLNEIKGHGDTVKTFCWAMDGAHIFSAGGSALSDCIIRQWQPIDGKERIVLRGHANTITSLCLSPDARYLVGALIDRSIRIWDLRTNRSVGSPLLHDNDLCDLAISPDGKYIVAAGVDAKIYVWNLDVALGSDRVGVRMCIASVNDFSEWVLGLIQNMHGRNVEPEAILKASLTLHSHLTALILYQRRPAPSTDVR